MSENIIKKKFLQGKAWLILLGGILGILLLVFGGMGEKKETKNDDGVEAVPDADAYVKEVEAEICRIASGVRGVKDVQVAVTLKGGYRAVYVTDRKATEGGYQNQTVLVGSGSSEGAVLLGYENPEISGIGIVCQGGSDPEVRERLVFLVSAAFDVQSHKIYIAEGEES